MVSSAQPTLLGEPGSRKPRIAHRTRHYAARTCRIIGEGHSLVIVPRSPPVRYIPARSPSAAMADQTRSHGSGSYALMPMILSLTGRTAPPWPCSRQVAIDDRGERRVTGSLVRTA